MYRIELLGGLQVTLSREGAEQAPITHFRTRKTGLLLAYLALSPHRHHGREELIEFFWPDLTMAAARDNLSGCLSSLRRQLGNDEAASGSIGQPSLLSASRDAVWLNLATVETIDVVAFESALDASSNRTLPVSVRRDLLESAVRLYRGPLLPDVYDEWALSQQTRLAQRYTQALASLADAQEASGEPEIALSTARRARQADPFAEAPCQTEMRILASGGQPEAARRVYQDFAAFLDQELGCRPSLALQNYVQRLGQLEPVEYSTPPTRAALPAEDLPQPPTIRTTAKTRLPATLSRFWGREAELDQFSALLNDTPRPRLVTLTGPGGIGKTHFSLIVASRLATREPELRLVWVPLADLSDERLFLPALQQALGGQAPAGSALSAPVEAMIALLAMLAPAKGESGVVVLLDNLEHLLGDETLPGYIPSLIRLFLERVPGLTFVATSRRILGIEGEQEFPLGPLPLPHSAARTIAPASEGTLTALKTVPSVALFVERVRLVRPDFTLTAANASEVAAICCRLEGVPLALEMAAAGARSLSLSQMRERLDAQIVALQSRRRDLPPRHRSLRATVEWSWGLLDTDLQSFFLRLCVFRGGFTNTAAEAVGGDGDTRAPEWLARLQEHSLLIRRPNSDSEEERYAFLEPVREWGLERLAENDAAHWAARLRHARYFHDIMVESGPDVARYRRDEQNCLLARETLLLPRSDVSAEAKSVCEGLNVTYSLTFAWYQRGLHALAYQYLASALEQYRHRVLDRGFTGDPYLFARALFYTGGHSRCLGHLDQAERYIQEAQAQFEALDNQRQIAYCEGERGSIATERGNLAEAMLRYTRAVEVGREVEDKDLLARGLTHLAATKKQSGDKVSAHLLNTEAAAIFFAEKDWLSYTYVLLNQSTFLVEEDRTAEAQKIVSEALKVAGEKVENLRIVALLLGTAGAIAARRNQAERALRLLTTADRLIRESGAPLLRSESEARTLATGGDAWRAALSAEETARAISLGQTDTAEQAIAFALAG